MPGTFTLVSPDPGRLRQSPHCCVPNSIAATVTSEPSCGSGWLPGSSETPHRQRMRPDSGRRTGSLNLVNPVAGHGVVTAPLFPEPVGLPERAISPYREMGAYEALWTRAGTTFRSLSKRFAQHPGKLPSDFVSREEAVCRAEFVEKRFLEASVTPFGVRVHGAAEYPSKLRDASHPVEVLYYHGWWDLVASRSVAVVGTRNPSQEGLCRTQQLVRELVRDDFTVVSGLAAGIDRMAHETAIKLQGRTIAVLGTPLCHVYPKAHARLQCEIADRFLVVTPVPLIRYESQDYRLNRLFFPERNIVMAALTEATVIVEAGPTSGTLIQARAALTQGRKVFILNSCFENPNLTWPERLESKGAVRVTDYNDLRSVLD